MSSRQDTTAARIKRAVELDLDEAEAGRAPVIIVMMAAFAWGFVCGMLFTMAF